MQKFASKKTDKLKRITELAVRNIVAEAQRKVPVYQGRLRSSLKPIMSINKLSGRAFTNVEYAANVEFGTKLFRDVPSEISADVAMLAQNTDGNFDDMVKALKKWCRKKGIPENAAYPIAVKLLNVGQKPQPFLYPAFKAEKSKYIAAIKTIMNQKES
jgi:hypothetical protein